MTMSHLDSLHSPEQGGPSSPYRAVHLREGTRKFDDWMRAREKFVLERNWQPKTGTADDLDVYDANRETAQLGIYDQSDRLTHGMRLTPIQGFEQSLSWEMVENSSIQQQVKDTAFLDPDYQVWDLTRLVPGEAASMETINETIPRLFGEGLRHCIAQGDENPQWIFVLDSFMGMWLRRNGVGFVSLGQGKVNNDTTVSIFGCFSPAELANDLTSDFARRAMGRDES